MLTLKHLAVNSFNENIVYLHKDCSVYKVDDIKHLTKVEIHGGGRPVYAFLQVVEDAKLIKPNEIGANTEAFESLGQEEGSQVSLTISPPPQSISSIKRKVAGNVLSQSEYTAIINDIESKSYSNMDIASFLVASASFMTAPETLSLTKALVGENTLKWDNENMVVDHHCLGGIPGNKTDLIVAAIIAAYGLPMPKTASRSLTSCAGVADVMSVFANVDFDEKKLTDVIKKARACIVSYDGLKEIAQVNKLISSVERQIGVAKIDYIAASIIALKISAGVTHLVLDIPVGLKSRVRTTNEALRIRKVVEYVGDILKIEIDAVITDGSEPIGNGVGPVLEARDVMKVLRNKEDAPQDLREKSIFLAGRVLEFDPNLRGGQGQTVARELLDTGAALDAMNKIIQAQGKAPQPNIGHLAHDVIAGHSGIVRAIDNNRINKIGIWAGANKYQGAGLDLLKKVGDKVNQGDVLYKIHSCNATDFAFAESAVETDNGYEIEAK
jgi:thymidine phosphorylase